MINKKILIVDDSEFNRALLVEILENKYIVEEASDGEEAIEILRRRSAEFSIVLLDIVMPRANGFSVLAYMGKYRMLEGTAVIMISSDDSGENMKKAYEMGAFDYISRPFDPTVVHHRVSNTMLLYDKQNKLEDLVIEQIYEQQKNNKLMISILSHIVEFRNGESGRHVTNVESITELLLKQLVKMTKRYSLSSSDISLISTASALHDIGKISIPDEILNKPGKLTVQEFEIMKSHTLAGAQMLLSLSEEEQKNKLVKTAYEICRWHHERYDGQGYPDALAGDAIPISAQVVSIADVYDALTSERCYKRAYSHEQAVHMIIKGECGSFNPLLLDCLVQIGDAIAKVQSSVAVYEDEFQMIQDAREKLNQYHLTSPLSADLFTFEQQKNGFYTEISRDILFSYNNNTETLTLNSRGAEKIGLDKNVISPKSDPIFSKLLEEPDIHRIVCKLAKTSHNHPDVNTDIRLFINDKEVNFHCVIKTIWTSENKPKQIGFAGILLEVNRE